PILCQSCSGVIHVLLSFPTRRSSDLIGDRAATIDIVGEPPLMSPPALEQRHRFLVEAFAIEHTLEHQGMPIERNDTTGKQPTPRSEEHTSELQSRENIVCRLLLEKKK